MLGDLGFDFCNVEFADGDDRHQVGPIPALVVRLQLLDRRGFEDFGQANRIPLGVAGVAEEQWVEIGLEARSEALIETPLLQHHTALQLHLLRFEANGKGPVAEDLEGCLEDFRIVGLETPANRRCSRSWFRR